MSTLTSPFGCRRRPRSVNIPAGGHTTVICGYSCDRVRSFEKKLEDSPRGPHHSGSAAAQKAKSLLVIRVRQPCPHGTTPLQDQPRWTVPPALRRTRNFAFESHKCLF